MYSFISNFINLNNICDEVIFNIILFYFILFSTFIIYFIVVIKENNGFIENEDMTYLRKKETKKNSKK
jgi:hypothetical protein